MSGKRPLQTLLIIALLSGLGGCASTDPRDPLEGVNRVVYAFNDGVDRVLVKPVAKGYRAITPEPVDQGVTNFFSNLDDVGSAVNNLLQLKLTRAASDVGRVAINSTLGLLGLIDVASQLKLEKYGEDFGQTLGYWGIGPGPYLVLPFFGPRNIRDTLGMVADSYLDPVNYAAHDDWPDHWKYDIDKDWQYGLKVLEFVDMRADNLAASDVLEVAALDPYSFVRDAYLQRRESLVRDGQISFEGDLGTEDAPADW
ncbi:MAG: VacJ family lipoprotein [Gammaproteobacteria bacterium SHHR-1]|uniref:MlaA family lipoprotein n=1 Tax=Magnetovirga frankeli TaxID=947516 RepID=UPI001293BB34|nr:VacJ family lipoprotein [gamma proteobacterium SS-5]